MGAVKKAYQDWCERNDINNDGSFEEDFDVMQYRREFEEWLDSMAKKYSRDDMKGNNND